MALYENYIHIAKYIMSAQSVNETLPACQGEHTASLVQNVYISGVNEWDE